MGVKQNSENTGKYWISEPSGYQGQWGNNSFSRLGLFDGNLALSPLSVIDLKVQYAVQHLLTYIKMFVLMCRSRKIIVPSWQFGAGRNILGQKHDFCQKLRKNWNCRIK